MIDKVGVKLFGALYSHRAATAAAALYLHKCCQTSQGLLAREGAMLHQEPLNLQHTVNAESDEL